MAKLKLRKDVTLLGEKRGMAVMSLLKDVTLLGQRGTWLH